jgi:hypothetical protein
MHISLRKRLGNSWGRQEAFMCTIHDTRNEIRLVAARFTASYLPPGQPEVPRMKTLYAALRRMTSRLKRGERRD